MIICLFKYFSNLANKNDDHKVGSKIWSEYYSYMEKIKSVENYANYLHNLYNNNDVDEFSLEQDNFISLIKSGNKAILNAFIYKRLEIEKNII